MGRVANGSAWELAVSVTGVETGKVRQARDDGEKEVEEKAEYIHRTQWRKASR